MLVPANDETAALPISGTAVPFDEISGDDNEDTLLLKGMAEDALRFVRSRSWCLATHRHFFVDGVAGIVAICLFEVTIRGYSGNQWIWAFTGDIPRAYMLVESYRTPYAALTCYIDGLEAWAKEAQHGRTSPHLIPVNVPPTPEYAAMAFSRVETLRNHILPNIRRS